MASWRDQRAMTLFAIYGTHIQLYERAGFNPQTIDLRPANAAEQRKKKNNVLPICP